MIQEALPLALMCMCPVPQMLSWHPTCCAWLAGDMITFIDPISSTYRDFGDRVSPHLRSLAIAFT